MRTREVIVFVRRGGDVLAVRRSPDQGGYWHSVAGGVEEGESYADAAARELEEETGLVAEVASLERTFAYEGIRVESFLAEAPPGWEPTLDWEHDEYRWVSPTQAADLLYWPEPREIAASL